MDPDPNPVCPERMDPDPDWVCPERLDPDPICPESLDPDSVNIKPDLKPCIKYHSSDHLVLTLDICMYVCNYVDRIPGLLHQKLEFFYE